MKVFGSIIVWLVTGAAFAAPDGTPLQLGVLAFRPKPQVTAQWAPVAAYLQSALEKPVELRVYDYAELEAAAARRAVDVVITAASHLFVLQHSSGLSSPLATLVTREGSNQLSAYGGVILARADRVDLASLADLVGKTIATVATEALGGYQCQAYELLEARLPLPTAEQLRITGQPHDRVIEAVLAGRADAGFVRAGVLESMEREGKLDPSRIRVINRQNLPTFPFAVSTRLYPEWPVAVMPQIDPHLASRVAAALFLMTPDQLKGSSTSISGFAIPANYDGVENLLRRMRLPPFDRAPEITLSDLWRQYNTWMASLAVLLVLLAATSIGLVVMYRQARQSLRERQRAEAALQASETKYRIVADNTFDWEFWQTPDGQIIYTSPSCKRISGYGAQDFITDVGLFRRIIHVEDQQRYDQHLSDSITSRVPSEIEYRVILPDGSVRWIDHVCQPVFDEAGNYLGRRGSNRDITGRKRAEEALRKLNDELERRVKERTAALEVKNMELEQMIKVFVGRELRMAELKEQVRRLEKKAANE